MRSRRLWTSKFVSTPCQTVDMVFEAVLSQRFLDPNSGTPAMSTCQNDIFRFLDPKKISGPHQLFSQPVKQFFHWTPNRHQQFCQAVFSLDSKTASAVLSTPLPYPTLWTSSSKASSQINGLSRTFSNLKVTICDLKFSCSN